MAEVVLFHHAQGLTSGVVAFADELRRAGHTVHTPDLLDGRTFGSIEDGMAYALQIGFPGEVLGRGARAVEGLPDELVYAGFSLGVLPAQMLAQTRPGARGALLFYSCVPVSEFGPGWPEGVPAQIHGMDADPIFAGEGDIDFKAQLTAIRAVRPDVVFVPGYYTEVGLIARQARELGITVPLLGGDGWDSPRTVEIGGNAVNGCYFSNHYAADDPNPIVRQFIEKFRQKYSEVPDAMAVLGYDATQVLADAMKRAGTTEGKKLRDAIAATKDFPGVSGKITIDEKRNARKSIVVLKIENGKVKFFQKVEP